MLSQERLPNFILTCSSAFWGQSFVAELTRISAHGEKKLKLRRKSVANAAREREDRRRSNNDNGEVAIDGQGDVGELGTEDEVGRKVASH